MIMAKKCDNCNKIVEHGEKVVAIIPEVEISCRPERSESRLKLSKESIESRSVRIYCKKCLPLEYYLINPTG